MQTCSDFLGVMTSFFSCYSLYILLHISYILLLKYFMEQIGYKQINKKYTMTQKLKLSRNKSFITKLLGPLTAQAAAPFSFQDSHLPSPKLLHSPCSFRFLSSLWLCHPLINFCSLSKAIDSSCFKGFKSCANGKDNRKRREEAKVRKLLKFPRSYQFLALTYAFLTSFQHDLWKSLLNFCSVFSSPGVTLVTLFPIRES